MPGLAQGPRRVTKLSPFTPRLNCLERHMPACTPRAFSAYSSSRANGLNPANCSLQGGGGRRIGWRAQGKGLGVLVDHSESGIGDRLFQDFITMSVRIIW